MYRALRKSLALPLSLWLTLSLFLNTAQAHRAALVCSNFFTKLEELHQDSAVELEMTASNKLFKIFTTTDGTIGPVLRGQIYYRKAAVPDWLKSAIQERGGWDGPWEKLPWDKLTPKEQVLLIRDVFKQQGAQEMDFFRNRVLPGVLVKDKVTLYFKQPTDFLGVHYEPGYHEIDTRSFLSPKVEMRGPGDLKAFSGVELHFRTGDRAGRTSVAARQFQEALGVELTHQHVHTVAELPMDALKNDPIVQSALLTDFMRRANFFSESVGILSGIPVRKNAKNNVTYFDHMYRNDLEEIFGYFTEVAAGGNPKIGDRVKLPWVAFRGSDKYDKPGLWGIEVRRLNPTDNVHVTEQMLDALQASMQSGNFHVDPERMRKYLELMKADTPYHARRVIANAWYTSHLSTVQTSMLEAPKALAPYLWNGKVREALAKTWEQNQAVRMLTHDFSKDVLFFDKPERIRTILAMQERSLVALKEAVEDAGETAVSPNTVMGIMQDFLVDSGIAKDMAESLGIQLEKLPVRPGTFGAAGVPREHVDKAMEEIRRRAR